MRKDMAKVLVERSRLGGKNDRKGRKPRSWEDYPKKQSMKKTHSDTKSLNENLRPLVRFLKSKVGEPWDNVFSEICENLKLSNPIQKHVRDHVWDYVQKNAFIKEGKVYSVRKFGGQPYELRNEDLYIDPETKILKLYKANKREKYKYDPFKSLLETLRYADRKGFLFVNERGNAFKLYDDKIKGERSVKNKATSTHAEHDFKWLWNHYRDSLLNLYHHYQKRINVKHEYWSTIFNLLHKAYADEEAKFKKSLHSPGTIVEVSEDGGATWTKGLVNRIHTYFGDRKPTYWVTVGSLNKMISPYNRSLVLRKKN